MKSIGTKSKKISRTRVRILVAATGVLSIGIALGAAVPKAPPRPQASQSQSTQPEKFQGEVSPEPDQGDCVTFRCRGSSKLQISSYSLVDELYKGYFFLDGKQLKEPLYKYAWKRVEIAGTLDEKSRTVHIESIKSIGW